MFRKVLGFAVVAVAGVAGVNLLFGVVGSAIALLTKLIWLGLIAFIAYSIVQAATRAKASGGSAQPEAAQSTDENGDDDEDDGEGEAEPAAV